MYNWLDQQGEPFFEHFKVIHAKGEFSRRGAGGELISTNGVEGVFSRMKRLLRGYRASPSDASQYGDHLGEFLWRMRFVRSEGESWRRNAFWHILKVLKWKYKPNFVDPNRRWAPPPELQAEVDALQAAAALPRARRPGGRFGKRPRTLAIEDGQVEEVEAESGGAEHFPLLAIEDQRPDVPVLVAPPRKRQRVPRIPPPAEEAEPDDTQLFTPEQVVNTARCEARVWGGGRGGQCTNRKSLDSRFCKLHGGDAGPSHGCVDGPIPPKKLKAFRSHRLSHREEDPCVVGVDYF